jgi:hypothetical protein
MIGLLYFSSGQDGWYFQKLYKLRLLTLLMKGTSYKYLFKQASVNFSTSFPRVKRKIQYIVIEKWNFIEHSGYRLDCRGSIIGRSPTFRQYEAHPVSYPKISVPQFEAACQLADHLSLYNFTAF